MKEVPASADAVTEPDQKRRDIVRLIPLAALGTAALSHPSRAGARATVIQSIQIPKEFTDSLAAPVKTGSFVGGGQSGAQIFANLCVEEDLAAMFCAPGNYPITHAIAEAGIPSYGGRTEGGMSMAADGFARATGEVVACSGTEGPGFTHMIQSIYTAQVATSPLLVLASNMSLTQEDTRAFIQQLDQQPITSVLRKYGKRITVPDRLREYGAYAFRALKTGVPAPVHLDFPSEVATATFKNASALKMNFDKAHYRTESVPSPSPQDMARAVEMIARAERPLLIAGQGVFQRQGAAVLLEVVGKHEMGVAQTGPSRGQFPDDHPLSLANAPNALMSADLIIFVGQYFMPTLSDFALNPDAKTIRVHPDPQDIGRNWPIDLGIVSDCKLFLEELANRLPLKRRPQWAAEIAAALAAHNQELDDLHGRCLKYSRDTNRIHPAVMGRELYDFFYKGKIDPRQTLNIWGGLTAKPYTAPYLRANRPGQGICSYYQSGTIGSEFNHAIGAAAAVKQGVGVQAAFKGAPVLVQVSDAGLAYGLAEFDTAAKYKLPIICVVYNNNAWGTYIGAESTPRATHLHLFQENLRYDKVAEALGCGGEYAQTPEELRAALGRAYERASRESIPTLINCQAIKEFSNGKLYPPGIRSVVHPGAAGFWH
jgi:thiamine pyrophosphate-dependent acetolactate synthase large subunit-like protein